MKKIVYSPDSIEKIQQIERRVSSEFGKNVADKVKKAIVTRIRSLKNMEKSGISMYDMYGITPDYRRLYVAHNYIFYLIEDQIIHIVNIYHEKEDFMYKLYGISSEDVDS